MRIAVIDENKCKPDKCNQECKKFCPPVSLGKECVVVEKTSKVSKINESLCIGCGICVNKCPFSAIKIVNVPQLSYKDILHSFGGNRFRFHKLPHVKKGNILGLLGPNGIGKSTVLKILSNKIKPNFGEREPLIEKEIVQKFKGTESHSFFEKIYSGDIVPVIKPQHVDLDKIESIALKTVEELLSEQTIKQLEMEHLRKRTVSILSGGEMQKVCIGIVGEKKKEFQRALLFDEPTNFLDIKQRVCVARYINSLSNSENFIIVCDHDLSILDMITDFIHLFIGEASVYGMVSQLYTSRQAINIYLDGYSPSDNMRFRTEAITFKPPKLDDELLEQKRNIIYEYSKIEVKFPSFSLEVAPGAIRNSEIVVLLGENGMGKTSYLRAFAEQCKLSYSIKPQKIEPKFDGTVEALFNLKIREFYSHEGFRKNVVNALGVDKLLQNSVRSLSGGERQIVAICLCLGKVADIYLIDEPSSFLDCEKRVLVSYVIKKFIYESHKTAFVVEHDLNMSLYIADRVVVFEGEAGVKTTATEPMNFVKGMNRFLKSIDITLRTDPENGRPRINKLNGAKDTQQKKSENFYSLN